MDDKEFQPTPVFSAKLLRAKTPISRNDLQLIRTLEESLVQPRKKRASLAVYMLDVGEAFIHLSRRAAPFLSRWEGTLPFISVTTEAGCAGRPGLGSSSIWDYAKNPPQVQSTAHTSKD